jgi:transposase-like protein
MTVTTDKPNRRHWSSKEKADIVRQYLRGERQPADLAEQYGISPAQIYQWAKTALEGLENTFERETPRAQQAYLKALTTKESRITELQEVVTELSTEILKLKKNSGAK